MAATIAVVATPVVSRFTPSILVSGNTGNTYYLRGAGRPGWPITGGRTVNHRRGIGRGLSRVRFFAWMLVWMVGMLLGIGIAHWGVASCEDDTASATKEKVI